MLTPGQLGHPDVTLLPLRHTLTGFSVQGWVCCPQCMALVILLHLAPERAIKQALEAIITLAGQHTLTLELIAKTLHNTEMASATCSNNCNNRVLIYAAL